MNTRSQRLAALLLAAAGGAFVGAAQAQSYRLEGAVIDSRNSQNLGVVSESGEIASLFRAQKAMTYGILRSAGISLEQLPPEVRARIERFATSNLEAFRAFSQGLDLKDQGKYVEAREAFRRAAELDPGFALAIDQQRAMPDVNLGTGLQTRAVLAAAAGAAVDRGKATVAVDTAQAVAALSAGLTVVVTDIPASTQRAQSAADYRTQDPLRGFNASNNLSAGIAYAVPLNSGGVASIAIAQEWRGGSYIVENGALRSLGNPGTDLLAERRDAVNQPGNEATLSDGTKAYWGAWLSTPTASPSVTVRGQQPFAVERVDYVLGEATRQMPGTGTALFTPAGGSLQNVSGNIAVNFVNRGVELRNLGFDIGAGPDKTIFAGLNGSATYAADSRAGAFSGNYSSGSCTAGCSAAFGKVNGSFGGLFTGRNADGLVFSTFIRTSETAFTSGVHLFTATPPAASPR